jgi:LPXTG-motif cell wall-anchored protein
MIAMYAVFGAIFVIFLGGLLYLYRRKKTDNFEKGFIKAQEEVV